MGYDPTKVIFCDTETSGLDPERHEIWEVALIDEKSEERYLLGIDETKADLIALNIGGYHERHPHGRSSEGVKGVDDLMGASGVAKAVARDTHGRHIVGAVPDFDARFLTKLLTAHGRLPSWHYHLIDVEALMVGRIMGTNLVQDNDIQITLPWSSRDLSRLVGVDIDQFEAHTALGDARWAKACFEAVMGGPS